MAVTLEQVERLREKAAVSYEEAKQLLEQTGGDLLDALILLERQGRVDPQGGGFYSTRPGGAPGSAAAQDAPSGGGARRHAQSSAGTDWRDRLREIGSTLVNVLRHSTSNQMEVWRHGQMMTSVPVLILVILAILAWWITVPLLIIGLVAGCRYRFSGPDLGRETINDAMDTVSETVDDMVGSVKRGFQARKTRRK